MEKISLFYDGGSVNAGHEGSSADGWTSCFLEPGRRIAEYTGNQHSATYNVESQGSTTLRLGDADERAAYYQAYSSSDSATPNQTYDFGYQQEFTDNVNGLVYLRSRFYQLEHASFITMDSTHKENRYTYGAGDPINLSDGTGHSERGAMLAGTSVGTAVALIGGVVASLILDSNVSELV